MKFRWNKWRTNSDALQNLINSEEGLAVSPEPSINTDTCCVDDTSFLDYQIGLGDNEGALQNMPPVIIIPILLLKD